MQEPTTAMAPAKIRQPQAYAASSLERALSILEAFTEERPVLTLSEVVQLTGLNKTTAFRLLAVLCRRGFVSRRQGTGQYTAGVRAVAFAGAYHRQFSLLDVVRPVIASIRDQVNETIILGLRHGYYRIDVEYSRCSHQLQAVVTLGVEKPLHVGAGGRALLSSLSAPELADYFACVERRPLSKTTLVEQHDIEEALVQIRRQGFAESFGEANTGLAGIAAPINDPRVQPAAALIASIPMQRLSPELRERVTAAFLHGVQEIRRRL
ncbi:MAG: hypothetical protein JWP20_108 [Roseomonas sp.]|nr:hypothetical protein [Roseomonas sp.]